MNRKFNDQELYRRKKLEELVNKNKNPYSINKVGVDSYASDLHVKYDNKTKEELESMNINCSVMGRVMNIRQTFIVIKDSTTSIQLYLDKKDPAIFEVLNDLHIGDIVFTSGIVMKTKTDELTIKVNKIQIVSKSLKVLPEKYHGLEDEEERSRRRYVDLIVSDESRQVFINRSIIIREIREFMNKMGYLEVETPILQSILGGANAKPFITHHNTLDMPFYLRIAPELYLKRLIVGGLEKVYEIGRLFRNEGMDSTHNPEFTTLEAYAANNDMYDMMELAENLLKHIINKMQIKDITFKGHKINFNFPFKRISMVEFVLQETKIDFSKIVSLDEALKVAQIHKIKVENHQKNIGQILNLFFEKYCEDKCIEPTFVYGHPVEISPLAKKNIDDPRYTERFELFIGTKEFMNAFSELNDPIDQYERFESQMNLREMGDDEANEMDIDFVEALEFGMPPTGGIGIGIDRLVMLLNSKDSIRDVLLFPHMKNKN
jgi:lysyl-tRNA synthetase, class II